MEQTNALSEDNKQHLLKLAKKSIEEGIKNNHPAKAEQYDLVGILGQPGASFVTLTKKGELRGCIGSLEPHRALAVDVLENAYSAAFRDYRFSSLQYEELELLKIKISVLTPKVPLAFSSEQDLISKMRPGIDGLVLIEKERRGTFLPSVWEQLPRSEDFLRHLKRKAGLPMDYWSPSIRIERYTTVEFG